MSFTFTTITPRPQIVDYMGIEFRDATQQHRYKVLYQRNLSSTRYPDYSRLRTLGLYDSIHYMYESLQLSHFMTLKHRTYARLTLELLSSLDYMYERRTHRVNGGTIFKLFNKEYSLYHNDIGTYF